MGWQLRLFNAADALLGEYPLQLHLPEDGDRHKAGFVQFIPDHPEAARLQLIKGPLLVAQTGASLHPPRVVLEKVEVDAGKQQLFFQWTGEDPDGELLFFTLQFSPDDGESWQTLQANYGQQSYATSTRFLPGGAKARVRVIATDGFNAARRPANRFSWKGAPRKSSSAGSKMGIACRRGGSFRCGPSHMTRRMETSILDGALRADRAWAGTAGEPSTSAMLRIGRYDQYPQTHHGLIDEVTLWNTALTEGRIQELRARRLIGNEENLLAFWPFDEGTGPQARDVTGHGHDGAMQHGPVWTEFTLPGH
jgi:hypothetical protein